MDDRKMEQEFIENIKNEFIYLEIQGEDLESIRQHYVTRLRQCADHSNAYCLLSIGLMEVVNYFCKLGKTDLTSRYSELAKRTLAWINL